MDNTYTSTRVGKVNDFHPLRNSIDKWRGKQMSNNTWTKINNFWTRNVENQFVQSGFSMIDDFLETTPQGSNIIKKIVNDMRMRKDFSFE